MAMRLVWPDEETMPKKRKPKSDSPESPVVEVELDPQRDTLEAQDGPIEPPAIEESADDEAIEPDDDKSIDLGILEALLFSTHHPLTGQRLGELLDIKSQKAIRKAVQDLNKQYEDSARTFRV
ncbi:MAG: hypothetical protein JWN40_5467 [Phycisphaerales bacterium]|nr:hypothetical protein [Phycisphaerales bacterium]